ncbi:MAG: bile acid:sodium symporter family protein, partial [Desulfurococcales archaeon]|nr:bile acid:sodium symporter family protein [Desulfurococcales archaeon]
MGSKLESALRRFPDFLWVGTIIFTFLGIFLPGPFLSLKPAIKPLLGSVIAAMGLTLSIADFKPIFRYPKRIFVGWLSQYLVMPLAGFAVAYFMLLPFSKEWVAGQVLTGGCPTGVVSNVYTYLASGNVALSVTLSALNTIIAPFITPWYTQALAGRFVPVNPWSLFLDMIKILLLPVLAGMLINTLWGKYVAKIRPYLPAYSTLAVITIVGYVAAAGSGKILTLSAYAVAALIGASVLHLFIGYGGGLTIAKAF